MKLLLLLTIPIFAISCTTTVKNKTNVDQIANESYQDSLNNYNELKFLFENKKYNEAYNLLDDMKDKLPYSRFTKHGKILEIHSYYERKKFKNAIIKASEFISTHPIHAGVDYVLYLRALSSFELNKALYQNLSQIPNIIAINRSKVRQTFSYFSVLAQRFPKSNYFKDVIKKIKKLRQILAEYELNDSYLLFDVAKYDEVVKHVDYILKNYPQSPTLQRALKLQAKAYRLLGHVDTAKSIETNLRRNYTE